MPTISLDLPESFFNEEIRSGYTVTKDRKELWAVELDLLFQLDEICRKHGLSYMLGAGSLLGVIRHKGFIPWDDDIDIYMLRRDYDKLISCWHELKEPYFLQSGYTEREYVRKHAQLRNSHTTAFCQGEENWDVNRGVFIDIFPIDGIPDSEIDYFRQERTDKWFDKWWTYYFRKNCKSTLQVIKRAIIRFLSRIIGKNTVFRAMEKNLSHYSKPDTKMWGNRTIHFDCPRSRRPLEDYTNLTTGEFEGFQVPIPVNYDAMLRQQYGDYMKIPEIKPASIHGELTVSTSVSYRDYLKKREN